MGGNNKHNTNGEHGTKIYAVTGETEGAHRLMVETRAGREVGGGREGEREREGR